MSQRGGAVKKKSSKLEDPLEGGGKVVGLKVMVVLTDHQPNYVSTYLRPRCLGRFQVPGCESKRPEDGERSTHVGRKDQVKCCINGSMWYPYSKFGISSQSCQFILTLPLEARIYMNMMK